jgi:peptidyl-prolyl cis-trans isomerase A (cyclophilin A)
MKRATLFLFGAVLLIGCSSSSSSSVSVTAPAEYKVKFDTSRGVFVVDVHRDWAPVGADRFYELVKAGFYDDARFFRVVPGFVVQWGLNKDPKVSSQWREKQIPDDPVKESNHPGYITFAKTGQPNSRTTQVFINLADNARLDSTGFAPFGKVTEGMSVAGDLYSAYGEEPQQNLIQSEGNLYLQRDFPRLDYIKTARVE